MTDAREIPLQLDAKREQVRLEKEQALADAYYLVFSSPMGSDILKDLREKFHVARSTLVTVEGVLDIHQSLGQEYQRKVVLYIIQQVQRGANGEAAKHKET